MHESSQLYDLVMDLELRHLRCLVAIVDAGTFTDAAIELGISQAAVSRNLMALEQVLGVRLLHRTSRTITPTTAGVHALAQAIPGSGWATRGRPWAGTPASSSAAGRSATRTSSCS
jgi:DNA-binding transcriptional LysR family regulator